MRLQITLPQSRRICRIVGVIFWSAAVIWMVGPLPGSRKQLSGYDASGRTRPPGPVATTMRFVSSFPKRHPLIDSRGVLRRGDPVFFYVSDSGEFATDALQPQSGHWVQAGFVEFARPPSQDTANVSVRWSNSATAHSGKSSVAKIPDPEDCQFFLHENHGDLEDVLATMFPPAKQRLLKERLTLAIREHGDELAHRFAPLIETSLRRSLPVIEEELRSSLARNREELDLIVSRWNDDFMSGQLEPLVRQVILPTVRTELEPTLMVIGRELWNRASIWSFTWRAIYDKSPLPRQDLMQREWDRFVEEEATDVIHAHADELVDAMQATFTALASHPELRSSLSAMADKISTDPQVRRLVQTVLRQTFVDNQRLRAVWREVWTSEESLAALRLASDRMEPLIRSIGDDLLGSREAGIDPDFARVLRNQVLGKDRRWLVAVASGAGVGREEIRDSAGSSQFPILHLAGSREPQSP